MTARPQHIGDLFDPRFAVRSKRHGLSKQPEYKIWKNMVQRCTNPKNGRYPDYGGRGITICPEWRKSFVAFFHYMGQRPTPRHSIDRLDNDRGYEPGNLRWATDDQQNRNQRSNLWFSHNGETRTLTDWARTTGIPLGTLYSRVFQLGWTFEDALSGTSKRLGRPQKNSKSRTGIEAARELIQQGSCAS